jgi:orotidine-5'-phosphate decarboxylase
MVEGCRATAEERPSLGSSHFADRVAEAVRRKRSQLVVGLDPVPGRLPAELCAGEPVAAACSRFCREIVDAVASVAVAVKPQSAFFEALGPEGAQAFAEACDHARDAGLLVIADAKRGDVGSTAHAYATAFLEPRGGGAPLADAVTVNPYLGGDSVEPFLAAARRRSGGVFCLVKTSNPGGADVQNLALADGSPLWQHVASLVRDWGEGDVGETGLSSVGAVVGATFPREVAEARRLLPRAVFLLPGVGVQGGRPQDLEPAFAAGPASALVSASRSVIYAGRDGGDWRTAVRDEAERLAGEIWAVAGRSTRP